MPVAILLKQVSVGTEIKVTQESVPESIPAKAYYHGWQ